MPLPMSGGSYLRLGASDPLELHVPRSGGFTEPVVVRLEIGVLEDCRPVRDRFPEPERSLLFRRTCHCCFILNGKRFVSRVRLR